MDDCELRRPPPSYTVDTVEEVRKREGQAEIYCLIGEDNVRRCRRGIVSPTWENLFSSSCLIAPDQRQQSISYEVVHRRIDISATEIRKRVALGRSIRYLVPPAVEEIIRRSNLYRELEK